MTKNNTLDAMNKMVELLQPLSSEERQRIIRASLTLLGDAANENFENGGSTEKNDQNHSNVNGSPRAKSWIKQNNITQEEIEHVFHVDGTNVEFISPTVPGNNGKEKTLNTFVLTGICNFLKTGEATFTDQEARGMCKTVGSYSEKHHASYMKAKGNEFTGSKEKGWTLTAPGLKHAASLIKDLCK